MSTHRRPEVFISATSADLRSCREMIKQALLTLQCVPVEQTNFPPDYRTVKDMLRAKIAACDAVIHVAGVVYGAEPKERAPGEPRRSYTQMEYDLARELKKPLYVFVCGEDFTYDEHASENDEKRVLQQVHRAALTASETLRYKVASREDLALRVRELQTAVDSLTNQLRKTRSWLGRGVAIGLAAALALGAGLWWSRHQTQQEQLTLKERADAQEQAAREQARKASETESRVAQIEAEMGKQRHYIKAVADAFTETQSQLRKLNLTDEQIFERAIASVAEKERLLESDLRAGITLFVAAIKADPKADFYDRALAEFAQKNFAASAENAGHAGQAARAQYLAADQLIAQVTEKADTARNRAREAFGLQGRALFASQEYAKAATAFDAALEATPRATSPEDWAELKTHLGSTYLNWAKSSEGPAATEYTARAVATYHSILEVYTREKFPQAWAVIQNNLALALGDQALRATDQRDTRLVTETISAFRAALEVRTREKFPQHWAETQNSLAIFLFEQALRSPDPEALRLLDEVTTMYRAALEVHTREKFPKEWARLQNNLANALRNQASRSTDNRLFTEAALAYRSALEVFTHDHSPQDWAGAQNNLANTHREHALRSSGADAIRLLAEAIAGYQATLGIYTREQYPQDWAMAQNNLAAALNDQAKRSAGSDAAQLLAASVTAYRAVLTIYTREQFPRHWAMIQNNLANSLRDQAKLSRGEGSSLLLAEANVALRGALEVFTRERFPGYWVNTQRTFANTLREQAEGSDGDVATRLLDEAATAYRALLGFFTREQYPQDWALTQNNLAITLRIQADRSQGAQKIKLLRETVIAMRACLEINTAATNPDFYAPRVQWIANTETEIARLISGDPLSRQ